MNKMERVSKSLRSGMGAGVLLFLMFAGCRENVSLLPMHDEVLVYPLPFDLVYLKTLEAADAHPDWDIGYTLKEEGVIGMINQRFSSFADADLRSAKLVVKRKSRNKTSVEFAPESRAIVGGDEILKLVKQSLSAEADLRKA